MSIIPQITTKTYTGFTPTSIPGCSLWLDAADSSSNSMTLSGSTVTTWKDKSGNGYSGTSSGSPTIVSNGQNGLSVVNFVSSSLQYFNFGDINDLGTNPFHIFVVSKYNDTSNGALVVKTVAGNSAGRYALFRESGSIIPLIESPGGNSTGGASDTSTSTRILTMFWNRSTLGLLQNGTSIVSGTQVDSTNLGTTFPFLVGAYNNGSGGVPPAAGLYFNGYMMEVIMYLGTITTSQRQQVEGYLAQKWGLTSNLPTTHPFKTTPLYTRVFQPVDVSTCSLWFDGADASTVTLSGSNITAWADKSGNGCVATQATTAKQATWSNPGVQFSTSAWYNISNTVYTKDHSMFVVGTTTTAPGYILGRGPASDGSPSIIGGFNGTRLEYFDSSTQRYTIQLTPSGTWIASYTRKFGGNINGFYNGTLQFTQAQTFDNGLTPGWPYLNTSYGDNFTDKGNWKIFEILVFNSELTTSQRQQIEGYLANKWGLRSNIPSTHPFKLYPALSVQFLPINISTCSLWLDPSDTSTLFQNTALTTPITADGQTIQGIKNKVSTSSATGSSGPTFKTNIRNGLNIMRYTGSQSLTTSSYTFTTTNVSIFAVGLLTSSASGYYKSIIYGSPDQIVYLGSGNGNFLTFSQGNWGSSNSPDVSILNSWSLMSAVFSGTVLTPYLNGTSQNTKTATSPRGAVTSLSIGGNANWIGDIAEIIIYDSALSTSERQQVEGYLAWKWGLVSNLPATHPFKKIRP